MDWERPSAVLICFVDWLSPLGIALSTTYFERKDYGLPVSVVFLGKVNSDPYLIEVSSAVNSCHILNMTQEKT